MDRSRLGALRTASSCPRGIRATVDEQVGQWRQQFDERPLTSRNSDPEMKAGIEPHARMGIGLPMSNIFAT